MRSPLLSIFLFCLLPFYFCLPSDGRAGVVRAELGGVAFGEHVDEFVVEVVVAARHFGAHALVVHLARAVYVLAQTFVEVCGVATVANLLLVVELYLADEQAGEAPSLVVVALVLFGDLDGEVHVHRAVAARLAEWRDRRRGRRRRFDGGRRLDLRRDRHGRERRLSLRREGVRGLRLRFGRVVSIR